MGYTKVVKVTVDSNDVAMRIADDVADYISDMIRNLLECFDGYSMGTIDDILGDNDFWNGVIEDLIPRLKA